MILLNPRKHSREYPDERSREIILETIAFFENRGKKKLKEAYHRAEWYSDFLEFLKQHEIFATLLTPPPYGGADARWDTWRNCEFNEVLGFYGLQYWYAWQVTVLGLGPLWMSKNEALKRKTARLLKDGGIFGFGLSEKEHGADVYSTDMVLTPRADGTYSAAGSKYYIGNGNEAALVSTFGKMADSGDYVFFAVDPHHPKYECVQNVVAGQSYVAEYRLHDYPITDADIISKGREAWDAALNTVNIGKYNLGWASIGICEHSFYEAINHAANRKLYNMYVTDFSHVKQMFVDAYVRLVAMKLFALRAADYMRSASLEDRRYLLYNPMVKMQVTTQGEEVINLLWDVIAAKGFEKDMYFEESAAAIRALPKLEGTVHVNIALIVKFIANYFFNPGEYAEVPQRSDAAHDDFLFDQGPTRGLGKIRFHDYRVAYDSFDLPNVKLFAEQIAVFKDLLANVGPTEAQSKDIDFLLVVGEIFALVVYGQLILENARIYGIDDDLVDQIFDFMVRDVAKFATTLHGKPSSTPSQMEYCLRLIRKPAVDETRYENVWRNHVHALKGAYEMNPGPDVGQERVAAVS